MEDKLFKTKLICHICEKEEELIWNAKTNRELTLNQMCFTCNHWREHLELDQTTNKDRYVIVKGVHYLICPEQKEHPRWNGFGGAKFYIYFKDGRRVSTTNLWCQGHISEKWIDKFPDNAVFNEDNLDDYGKERKDAFYD